jgi:hypothetical protein
LYNKRVEKETTMKKLTPEERADRAELAAERARINALYAQGAMGRQAPKPEVAEPERYVVKVLPSAYVRKQAALKAAETRRLRRLNLI